VDRDPGTTRVWRPMADRCSIQVDAYSRGWYIDLKKGSAKPQLMNNRHHQILTSAIIIAALTIIFVAGAYAGPSVSAHSVEQIRMSQGFADLMSLVRESSTRRNLLIVSGVIALAGGEKGTLTVESYLKAAILAEMVVGPLKYITNRERPAGSQTRWNSSFPSSHAAMGFAVAATVSREYPRFSIPAYALAALVSCSRVYHRRHHLSDVVIGAAIGLAAAHYSNAHIPDFTPQLGNFRPRATFRIDDPTEDSSTVRVYFSSRF
jgi:membrane-associated phospholipid phosphatase